MVPLTVAAALAVALGALVAAGASDRRGMAAGVVVAGLAVRLVEPLRGEPLVAGFGAAAMTLTGYLLFIRGRGWRHPGRAAGRAGRVLYTLVGALAGAGSAVADPSHPTGVWPLAAAGAGLAAALVLMSRSGDARSVGTGAALAFIGARLVWGSLAGPPGALSSIAFDLAVLGAAAHATAAADP